MREKLHLLVIEDNPADVDLILETLPEGGEIDFDIESVPRLSKALTRLGAGGIDLVLVDLGLPDSQGLATFRELHKAAPEVAIIVLTALDDQELAVTAVREGAQDYLVKGQLGGSLFVRTARYAIERKRVEEKLHQSHEIARAVLNAATESVFLLNMEGDVIAANETAGIRLGIGVADLVGSNIYKYFPPDVAESRRKQMDIVRCERKPTCFVDDYMGGWIESSIYPIFDAAGQVKQVAIYARDITERKKAEDELQTLRESLEAANLQLQSALEREQKLAHTDPLTGINNRRSLFELAEHEIAIAKRYHQPLAVMMFDFDFFKKTNDTYGHTVGDQMLQRVTQVACANLRTVDVIGRYGGEEFIIVLPMTNAQQAYTLAERIREGVAAIRMPTAKGEATVTLSIGIVEMQHAQPKHRLASKAETVEDMFRRADEAMYAAKQAGRNCTVIEPKQN